MNSGTLSPESAVLESSIRQLALVLEPLFDHVPDIVFFIKDLSGRYLAVNQTLVDRCGCGEKKQLLGKTVQEIFPPDLAGRYAAQDRAVVRTGRPVLNRLELHWYSGRKAGWCLTTKLPIREDSGRVVGLAGISRDLRAPGDREIIPASLTRTLEHLEQHYADPLSPATLARHAGLPLVRFERLIKRIFRITPGQLIVQTRLAAACRLLQETGQPISDIAHACGFYDHSAFTRAFRSAMGITPRAFREARPPHLASR